MSDTASSRLQDRSASSVADESTIPANLKFVVSNLRNLVTSPLAPDNFLIWKSQILKTLRANGFLQFLDPNDPPPPQFLQNSDGSSSINPSYTQWVLMDQNLSASICATISSSILPYVISLESTAQIWIALETRFQATNRSKIIQLKNALHNVALKNNSMTVYLSEIKAIVDQIAAAGSSVDQEDIIHYILNGLPQQYQSFKTTIRTTSLSLTLDQLYPLLLSEEINLASDAARYSSSHDPNLALFTNRGRGRRPRNKNDNSSVNITRVPEQQHLSTGSRPKSNAGILCQICYKKGHSAQTCWHRLNPQYIPSSKNTATALIASADPQDSSWYLDSGASAHLTNTMETMSIAQPYLGHDNITVGDGNSVNIVLAGDSTTYAWQSFDNPTDTILPTQMIRQGGKLSSRRSSRINDYSNGRFQLRLLPDGNLVLNTIGFPTEVAYERYWISNNTYQITDDRVFFNPNYGVNVVQKNTNLYNVTTTNFGSVANLYQRATLDFDGVFRQYKYNKLGTNTNGSSQNSWLAMDFVPRDICTDLTMSNGGSGACGFNSYCSINGDKPSCLCPDHYTPLDPDDIINQGCRPDFEAPSCELYDPADFEMVEKYNVDWPNEDYEQLAPMEEDGCKKACLEDCRCSVAVFGSGNCWKKKMPMSNGRIDPNNGRIVIFKISKVALNGSYNFTIGNKKDNKTTVVISLSAILGGSMLINFISIASVILLLLWKRRRVAEMKIKSKTIKSNLHAFSYMALEKATNKFNEELGKGSFGSVYKGVLISLGEVPVAVKKLINGMEHHGEKEFITELTIIGRTHHRNLVQLIGFCDEGSHRLLVYEFMSNGTLASYLFQTEKPRWEKRVQIAYGVARGLSYLHEECKNQIIHCDIKPQNILLDEYLTARISDFGLAKLLQTDQTRTKTSIRGTKGYVAPEWFKDKPITSKVDVYSFGVVLLEIVCCRKNVEKDFVDDERIILTDWAYDCYTETKLEVLVQYDADAITDHRRLERFVAVAIWCIQEEPSMRPSMKKVLQMLEGAVEVPIPPDPSSFISSIN
ncbi:hypothetical protein KFK09_005275 [Dendrobium nobile]|uniref:non-specific serine/threonine protein kinase n=1 Tax=Dendrobium nobile TaxID=94219 RepID=A0A8T3C0U8_DENNO|nr:hypothetical protein KFK09_005275 [Dendrobium nobile]